jgi:hypothetical protein
VGAVPSKVAYALHAIIGEVGPTMDACDTVPRKEILLIDLLKALKCEEVKVEESLILDEVAQILTRDEGAVGRANACGDDGHGSHGSVL